MQLGSTCFSSPHPWRSPVDTGQENAGKIAEDGGSYEPWIADRSGATGISAVMIRALPAARNVTATNRVHL